MVQARGQDRLDSSRKHSKGSDESSHNLDPIVANNISPSDEASPDQRQKDSSECTTDSEEEAEALAEKMLGQQHQDSDEYEESKYPHKWTIGEANSNPFHFCRFLSPSAKEKFDALFTGRNSRGLSSHGQNMKQLY